MSDQTNTDTTPVEEPVAPAEEQPVNDAPVEEPTPDAPVEEPTADAPAEEPTADAPAEEPTGAADLPVAPVTAQEPKLVGEEANDNLADPKDNVSVNSEQVAAQVTQPREPERDTVDVHEVSVKLDEVILDTSDPRAVQVPPEGRSPLLTTGLPIAALDAERVEDFFAREASENTDDE